MQKNMGRADRSLRALVAVGAVAGGAALGFSSAGGIVLVVAAAIMAVTAASGYCPVYHLFGIKTTGVPASELKANRSWHLHRAA